MGNDKERISHRLLVWRNDHFYIFKHSNAFCPHIRGTSCSLTINKVTQWTLVGKLRLKNGLKAPTLDFFDYVREGETMDGLEEERSAQFSSATGTDKTARGSESYN